MKSVKHIELNSDLIDKITDYFPSKKFKSQSHLFYEGQIPISGYLVLDGSIQVSYKKKFKKMLNAGYLIGVAELLNKKPIQLSAEAFPNTEICFLDRTTLLEIFKGHDVELVALFKALIEKAT
jgi:CRP-like cAMP-binding protein